MSVRPSQISPIRSSGNYASLLAKVRKTLVEGQRRIEQERIHTYLEIGQIINTHILKYERADYGAQVIKQLAKDLNVGHRTLERCVQFSKIYPRLPIASGRTQLGWGHYRELMTVADDKKRSAFEMAVFRNGWSAEELALRIKEEKQGEIAETGLKPVSTKQSVSAKDIPFNTKPLTPSRGTLYTYKLVERPNIAGEDSGLLIDLGFGIYHEPSRRDGFQTRLFTKDQIIESKPKEDAYKFSKTDRTSKDLFTYAAYVEKVIDGDTIKVRLDLGFNVWTRQTLRLRGLDCPEVGTPKGDEARTFVRSLLKESQMIIVRSSRSDKYDRYLADVFIPQGAEPDPETDVYLNNLLLETGRAERMN